MDRELIERFVEVIEKALCDVIASTLQVPERLEFEVAVEDLTSL
ncbi:MAG TPA: hypothetical protein VK530_17125 [Candidatus Acidoferrum sp.]|nr:hypothetical protein [Candidatus Acidoferrum sp.]